MKMCLYCSPIQDSTVNFSCDTKREMDHQNATKCFRAGSNISAVKSRMSLIDPFNDVHKMFQETKHKSKEDKLRWNFTEKDLKFILPTAQIIFEKGLCTAHCQTPYNVCIQ